jgi:hypothetical protein
MFKDAFAQLEANPRLRIALAIFIALLWAQLIVAIQRAQATERRNLAATAGQLERARQETAVQDWASRAELAIAARNAAQSNLWRQASLGLAQASFLEWANRELARHDLKPRSVTLVTTASSNPLLGSVATVPAPAEGLTVMRVRFDAEFDAQRVPQFLAALAAAEPRVAVESLTVRSEVNPRFDGVLLAHFQPLTPAVGAAR